MSVPVAVFASELTDKFDPRLGKTGDWLGADSARSIPLGDSAGRVLWLFADTYWRTSGTGAPTSRAGSFITNDSLAVQHGPNLASAVVTFHQAPTPTKNWFPISETHVSWPMDGIVIGNDLYVTSIRVLKTSPLGGEYGWAMHKVTNGKTLPVTSYVSTLLYQSGDTGTRPVFSPYVEGGHVYAFATKRFSGWLWCRWTLADFTGTGTQGAVEWYTGAGWSSDEAQAFVISENYDTSEGSVHRRNDGRWIITDSVNTFPQLEGGIRIAERDTNGNFVVAPPGGYHPPPPSLQPGDHVKVAGLYDAVIKSVNSDGTRVVEYTPFWGSTVETRPLADLTRKNSSYRAAYKNPRFDSPPLPAEYSTYAYKAHPALGGPGLVVSFVDNGVLGAPLDIYFPKFYRIRPPVVSRLSVSDTGLATWSTSGGPDRLFIRANGEDPVELQPTDTSYQIVGYDSGYEVVVEAVGIGGSYSESFGGPPSDETYAPAIPLPPRRVPTVDWQIHPREANLQRVLDPISKWTRLVLTERHNEPDTWKVTAPSSQMAAFQPGTGSILYRDGKQITSGRLIHLERGSTKTAEGILTDTTTATFASDLIHLGHKIVLPAPNGYDMPFWNIFHFPQGYDLRSGTVESVILGFIRAHAGDQAALNRQVPRLRLPVSLNRGGYTQVSGRFDQLGTLVQSLAEAGNLRVRIVHTEDANGPWMDIVIDDVRDLSGDIRFGTAETATAGIIDEWKYEIGMPTTTRAIVAGGGEMEERDIAARFDLAGEFLWGVAPETLIDQRQVPEVGSQDIIEETSALIQKAYGLVSRSISGDAQLRYWIAGSPTSRTGQLGWSWLVDWDRLREGDLTSEMLSDLSRQIRETTPDDSTLSTTIDNIRNAWSNVQQLDDQIRDELDAALKFAWEGPPNELGHAASIINATNLLDQRIAGATAVRDSLFPVPGVYFNEAHGLWAARWSATLIELGRAGDEALKENSGLVKVSFTPLLGPDLEYRRDVRVGDIVGYDLPALDPAKDKIREATTTVAVQNNVQTETVSVIVGTPDAPSTRTQQQAARALRGVRVIQRST